MRERELRVDQEALTTVLIYACSNGSQTAGRNPSLSTHWDYFFLDVFLIVCIVVLHCISSIKQQNTLFKMVGPFCVER